MQKLERDLLQERDAKWRALSVARWDATECAALVLRTAKGRGKLWERVGDHRHGAHWLFVEEALLLAERGQLCLVDAAGEPLALRDVWALLPAAGVELPCYLAYRALRERGHTVRRCRPRFDPPRCCAAGGGADTADVSSGSGGGSGIEPTAAKVGVAKGTGDSGGSSGAAFEAFSSSEPFRMSCPGKPAFCVAVCQYAQQVPPLAALRAVQFPCALGHHAGGAGGWEQGQQVPLKLAVADDDGTVLLFDADVELHESSCVHDDDS